MAAINPGRALVILWALVMGVWSLSQAPAVIPEPDNIAYGQIFLGTNRITARHTNVVIEVRHSGATNVLSSYRMGRNPAWGDAYVVEIPIGGGLIMSGLATPTNGSVLDLVVKDGNVVRAQTNFIVGGPTLAERGYVQRIDFGTNTLTGFDAWLARYRLDADSGGLDSDQDGSLNQQEFWAGTNPTNATSKFLLRIGRTNGLSRVSFDAVRATGIGYDNSIRHYALEQVADLRSGNWQLVPGYADIIATDQEVVFAALSTGEPRFFRGKVWLDDAAQLASEFRLLTSFRSGQRVITFTALGPDPQGPNRYYTLEQTTNLATGAWVAVPGYSNILGAGQSVTNMIPSLTTGSLFYRGRFELRTP